MSNRSAAWLGLVLLFVSLLVYRVTGIDFPIQNQLYNAKTGHWLVDREAKIPKLLFYNGPKMVLTLFGVVLALDFVTKGKLLKKWLTLREAIYLALCLAFIPLTVGTVKRYSWMYCPYDLQNYGGQMEHRHLYSPHTPLPPGVDRGTCFPAGHASGGFALLAFYFLGKYRKWGLKSLLPGLIVGWTMGFYQMAKGAHFLSHTTTTMFWAWTLAAFFAVLLKLPEKPSTNASAAEG